MSMYANNKICQGIFSIFQDFLKIGNKAYVGDTRGFGRTHSEHSLSNHPQIWYEYEYGQ